MTVFRGGFKPDTNNGLMNLNSVKQMLFCIAQNESSAQELDAYSLLGISNILDNVGYEIEQAYGKMFDEQEAAELRHRKLRAAIAAYIESGRLLCKSDFAGILADDEKEATDAD